MELGLGVAEFDETGWDAGRVARRHGAEGLARMTRGRDEFAGGARAGFG